MQQETIAASPLDVSVRPCTCRSDDAPPAPCARKYALGECKDFLTGWVDVAMVKAYDFAEAYCSHQCDGDNDMLHELNTARRALREHLIEPLSEIKALRGAIERMRCAGGSAEFQRAFELAKDLLPNVELTGDGQLYRPASSAAALSDGLGFIYGGGMGKPWIAMWAGIEVDGYEGPSDLSKWDFSEEFPWICGTERGLDFVVPDWSIVDGEWEMVQVGIHLEDLIDGFIETENVTYDEQECITNRARAISALERAIETLRTKPLRVMKPNVEIRGGEAVPLD